MSDTPKSGGWFKALVGTIAGLLGGGAMMYISPLVDRVIKPGKPLANFSYEANGLDVTFHNRATGGDGYWDFGDGSALEPTNAAADVTHKFSKPGNYTVKLTVRNFLGDEHERSVPVDVSGAASAPPAILSLEAVPLSPQAVAPATFRLVSKAQNAETAVWDLGPDKPLEISSESPNQQERLVTFASPGRHSVQLAVLNGKLGEKRSVAIDVKPAPANTLMAVMRVLDSGTRVESLTLTDNQAFSPDVKPVPIRKAIPTRPGFTIVEAKPAATVTGIKGLTVQVTPDGKSAVLTGELQPGKATAKGGPPMVVVPVSLRLEKRGPATRPPADTSTPLAIPGTTSIPLAAMPKDWVAGKRQIGVEMRDGAARVLTPVGLPYSGSVGWQGRTYRVAMSLQGEQVVVTVQ
ncbi:MAG: PKD domain-containing protein [Gemmataceae bacterium]